MKYSREELERFRKYGDVTPNGVVFDWWLVSSAGAGFALIREPHHTDGDIESAKSYLRRERDVVQLRVARLEDTQVVG